MERLLDILGKGSNHKKSSALAGTRLFRLIKTLENTANVSYLLDNQHRFVYCNPAWDEFAESNGAPRLTGEAMIGRDLFDSIAPALHEVYADAFRQVAKRRTVWAKSYECSSPTVFRRYRMRIHSLQLWNWFLVTNPLLVTRLQKRGARPDERIYFTQGIIRMCAHCRCSQRVDIPAKWDFVPQYLRLKGLELTKVSSGYARFASTTSIQILCDSLINATQGGSGA